MFTSDELRMPDAARKDDPHLCPKVEPGPTPHVGGPILSGSPDVDIEFKPAARAGLDNAECKAGGPDLIAQGCGTVFINHKHAARVTDKTSHNGVIMAGAGTVLIGVMGDAVTVAKIDTGSGAGKGAEAGEGKDGKGGKTGDGKDGKKGDGKEGKESPVGESKNGNVFARFKLVHPANPKIGDELVFECSSWDPDTGGTSEAPNPERVTMRTWALNGTSVEVEAADTGRQPRWMVKTRAKQQASNSGGDKSDLPASGSIEVILEVTDEQGHTALTRLNVVLRGEQSNVGESSNGGVFARFERTSASPLVLGGSLSLVDTSWDPDSGGTPESPNAAKMKSRKWSFSDPSGIVLTNTIPADGAYTDINWAIRGSERGFKAGEAYCTLSVTLEVVDAQGHIASTVHAFKIENTSPEGVHADWMSNDLRVGGAQVGDKLHLRCASWDPDHGGARTSPNPESILKREWSVFNAFGKRVAFEITSTAAGTVSRPEFEFEIDSWMLPEENWESFDFEVELKVTDVDGHEARVRKPLPVRRSAKPEAIIGRLPVEPSYNAPGSTARLARAFICNSIGDAQRPDAPVKIISRVWSASRGAVSIPVRALPYSKLPEREVEIQGKDLSATMTGEPVRLTLRVRNEFNQESETSIDVSVRNPKLRIVSSRVVPLDPTRWQSRFGDVLVDGDGLYVYAEVDAEFESNGFEWRVFVHDQAVGVTTSEEPVLFLPSVVSRTSKLRSERGLRVEVQVRGLEGSIYYGKNTLERWINPALTARRAADVVIGDLLEKGVSVGIALAVGAMTGGVGTITWAAAAGALGGEIAEDGFEGLGVPSWLAPVLTMSVTRSADTYSFVIDKSKWKTEIWKAINQEASRRSIQEGSDEWFDLVSSSFSHRYGTLRDVQTRAAIDDALSEIVDAVRKYAGGSVAEE